MAAVPPLYGNIDIRQVSLGFRVFGKLAAVLPEEGDAVRPGDVLAKLDPAPFTDELRAAQARRDAAAAALEKARNGARPAEIDQARATVDERVADLAIAEQTFERYAQLVKTNAISREAFDQATASRDAARGRLKAAQGALTLLTDGTRYEDIKAAQAELRTAEAAVASAQTGLADTRLHSPAQGVILSRVREPGAIVAAGETVFVLSLDSPVWARAYVPESLLGKIHPGLAVDVFTDTEPNRAHAGVVGFVSPVAEFTPKSVETPELRTDLVYRFRVVINNPDTTLRQGMPVTIRLPRQQP